MKLRLQSLINIRKFQKMLDSFSKLSKVPVSVIDNEGTVLISSGNLDYNLNFIIAQSVYSKNSGMFVKIAPALIKTSLGISLYLIPIDFDLGNFGIIILGPVYLEKYDFETLKGEANSLGFEYESLQKSLVKVPFLSVEEYDNVVNYVLQFKEYIVERISERWKKNEIENQYKKAQQLAHVGNWEVDLHTRKTKWSVELANIFGVDYIHGMLSQQEIFDTVHPDDRAELMNIYTDSFKRKSSQEHIYRIIRYNDKEIRYVHHKWEFQKDKDGKPVKLIGIAQDITEFKLAEDARKISEERLVSVTDNANVWVWEVDSKGMYTYSNYVVKKILGYCPEAIIGKKYIYDLSPDELHEEYKLKALEVFCSSKPFFHFEKTYRHADGRTVILDSSGTPVYNNVGVLIGYRGTDFDITEMKRAENELLLSEKRFKAIFENAGIGIFLTDIEGNIIKMNKAFQNMLGYDGDYLVPKNIKSIIHQSDYKVDWNLFLKIIFSSRDMYQMERRFVIKEGGVLWAQMTVSAVRDENGLLQYAVGMVENITERKLAAEEMGKMNIELKELNSTKDKFFSIIAHDLKSPFLGMIGISEMLIDPLIYLTDSERKRRLSILHTAIVKQYELLQNLLGWAQIQLGKITYNPEKINLAEFSKAVISSLYPNAEKKNIVILNEIESKITVFADSNMLRSIIQNLITNAVKFTNNNGYVRLFSQIKNGVVLISIEDNGIGIKKENIIKILTPKYHFTTNGTSGEPGTGLGVLICRDMIEKHSGKLNITSEPGKGTIVTFTLPLAGLE